MAMTRAEAVQSELLLDLYPSGSVDHVFAKLGVVSRAQAVAEALRRRAD